MHVSYDVAVVGAGPGGAWTAACLARRGGRVLLVDPSHPREKPCGGGITARALGIVSPQVPVVDLPRVTIDSARFLDGAPRDDASVRLDGESHALTVAARTDFDALLLESARAAGADVRALRVTDVALDAGRVRLTCGNGDAFDADWVVGADGANSLVRRRMARPFRRDQLSIATGFFAHDVTSREIVIELLPDPPGYIWSFPRPNHLAIGICTQATAGASAAALRTRLHTWIERTGIAAGARLESYSWPIPSLGAADLDTPLVAGARWLTVGDAAGLVDPITREGIFYALQSAGHAAQALSAPDAARRFTERIRDDIGCELARAARLKSVFFHPRFRRLLMEALRSSEGVRRVMADLIAGTLAYGELKCRLLTTFELRLAWRCISGFTSRR